MTIQQPTQSDKLNSPDHSLSHRVIANDDSAPVQSLVVGPNGSTHIKEITTPTAIPDYGGIYAKSDNRLYFQDGAGVEHAITVDNGTYAEGYAYNNSVPLVIETADTPIGIYGTTSGLVNGFTHNAGNAGSITAYADYSGTVAGSVLVTSASHGLSTDDIITIRGTTNYNGIFEITNVSTDTFYIIDTWVANDGASDWNKPGCFMVDTGSAGIYAVTGSATISPDAACEVKWLVYINTTLQTNISVERKYAINDLDPTCVGGIITLSEGDCIWIGIQSDNTHDIIIKHANLSLRRL